MGRYCKLFGCDFLARGGIPGCAFCTGAPLFWQLWQSVPERASYGTEYAFGAKKGFLWYATRFQRRAVLKTGFYGTEGIFGAVEGLLWYGSDTRVGPRLEDTAECGSRFEDAAVVGVVPVAAAMDLLA